MPSQEQEQQQRRLAVVEYMSAMNRKYRGNWQRAVLKYEGLNVTDDNIEAIALDWKAKQQP